MQVLITGGAGFIGSHLAEGLIAQGHSVHVLDDLSTGTIDNLRGLRGESQFGYTITTFDGAKFFPVEGFGDVVIGPRVESFDLVWFRFSNREHNDANIRVCSDRPTGRKSPHARHITVKNDQVVALLPQLVQRLLATSCISYDVPFLG